MLSACSRLNDSTPLEAAPAEERILPTYVPEALWGGGLRTASTGPESVDAYFEERTRTFSNGETITYYVADGMVVEADMILHNDVEAFEAMLDEYERLLQAQEDGALESQAMFAEPHCVTRVIGCIYYSQEGRRWPNGIVYYDISYITANFSEPQRGVIYKAMGDIARDTGYAVQFRHRSSGARLIFKNEEGAGCNAELGYTGSAQRVMLGDLSGKDYGCANNLGTVIHELGHAVGLLHEHQRCDREFYIVVNTNNLTSKGRNAFDQRCDHESRYGAFDYLSIMMYSYITSDKSFVYNTNSPMFTLKAGSILPINPKTGRQLTLGEIGLLDFLSPRDIAGLKARY